METIMKMLSIDLGTTFSEAAVLKESGVVEVIPNIDGDLKTQSIASYASGQPVVGRAALPDLILNPKFVLKCAKRQMGANSENGKPIPLLTAPDGKIITAVDFSADVLHFLKLGAEQYLGCEIDDAVITVPAYFQEPQIEATVAAARIAGFKEIKTITEPGAAAIYHCLEKGIRQTLLVVDIGGGTCDLTVMDFDDGRMKTLAIEGDAELGGVNYDESVLGFIIQEARKGGVEISIDKDLANFEQHFDKARDAKESLARRETAVIVAESDGKKVKIELTRDIFTKIVKPVDKRFTDCCKRMIRIIKEKNIKLDKVLMVGGSGRLFHMEQMISDMFKMKPDRDVDPDFVIAKGASVWSQVCFGNPDSRIKLGSKFYLPGDIKIKSVSAHPICVAAINSESNDTREYNCQIVPANEELPYKFEEKFAPLNPKMNWVVIKMMQGMPKHLSSESTLLRRIEVPIQPTDHCEDRIVVKGVYTEEGLLNITVYDELLNQPVSDSFIHKPGLTESEIQEKASQVNHNFSK